ncbi:glycoside hydrolase family 15 protein [Agromyces flavus]|uniref:glycoside hydrolase family 15 protein n=1 Tax=Agromyces flavus TaxID=589382 RepID=UPI003622C023
MLVLVLDALARSGRLEEAELTFEKMLTYANHLGLYSEEIGLTGEQLGNFPQAFSHLALISAAMNLDAQLDHGPGLVSPVLDLARRAAKERDGGRRGAWAAPPAEARRRREEGADPWQRTRGPTCW